LPDRRGSEERIDDDAEEDADCRTGFDGAPEEEKGTMSKVKDSKNGLQLEMSAGR